MRIIKILAAVAVLVALVVAVGPWLSRDQPVDPQGQFDLHRLAAELSALEAREQEIAQTIWSKDLLAQQCGRVLDELWDKLNGSTNKLGILATVSFETLQPGRREPDQTLGHSITLLQPVGPAAEWTLADWLRWLDSLGSAGWEIGALEFRHTQFEVDSAGLPERSVFHAAAQLSNAVSGARATIRGDLGVVWAYGHTLEGLPDLGHIDASGMVITIQSGPPAFELVLQETVAPPDKSFFIDPLILHDLDGDGSSEIILAASNTLFRRQTDGTFERSNLCRHSPGLIFTAVIADFDGDGLADFLCAKHDGLHLYHGSPAGRFDTPPRPVWHASPRVNYGQVMTCGDVDGDGDLDVWLGQYKAPYERGQMPTPYYDANDGHPSWLLLNDGHGQFTDATPASGLASKRFRRSYSGSMIDLDADGDLDLLSVNDFAGVDLYLNDGSGRFNEVTDSWIPERHGFGMAHSFADFNRDGRLDFMVTGMHCPTALRLDHLGLVRPGREDYARFRRVMTAGNRLWLATSHHGFEQTLLSASVAHSGWSWSCLSPDFDNNGWPDLFIANGHETRQSVREYEPEFWLHDIYVGDSDEDLVRTAYFGAKIARTRGRGWSYGGYEINRLFLNRRGVDFVEVGHLFGVGLQLDSRVAVADDLDSDGRMDLLTTSFEVWPKAQQTLRIYRNNLEPKGNWIGFRFRGGPGGPSPIGATVRIQTSAHRMIQQIVTGDSHRAQHSWTVHFGLGSAEEVKSATVTWPNRTLQDLNNPAINQYHVIKFGQQSDRSFKH